MLCICSARTRCKFSVALTKFAVTILPLILPNVYPGLLTAIRVSNLVCDASCDVICTLTNFLVTVCSVVTSAFVHGIYFFFFFRSTQLARNSMIAVTVS